MFAWSILKKKIQNLLQKFLGFKWEIFHVLKVSYILFTSCLIQCIHKGLA